MLQSEAVTVTHWRIACLLTQFWDACSSYRRMWVLLFSLSSLLCHSRPVATGVVAVCAGGKCIAPDTCQCVVWWSKLRDGQGIPRFQTPAGDPQNSGWTGYDCNTPICVQAQAWVPIVNPPTLFLEDSDNSGETYQAACPNTTRCVNCGSDCGAGSGTAMSQGVVLQCAAHRWTFRDRPRTRLTSRTHLARTNHAYVTVGACSLAAPPAHLRSPLLARDTSYVPALASSPVHSRPSPCSRPLSPFPLFPSTLAAGSHPSIGHGRRPCCATSRSGTRARTSTRGSTPYPTPTPRPVATSAPTTKTSSTSTGRSGTSWWARW